MDYRQRWELKEYHHEQRLQRRVVLLHAGVFLLLLSYLLRFWYLQGVQGDQYAQLAEGNRLRRVVLAPTRGPVYDRRGEIIASTRPSLSLVLQREGLRDADRQLRNLERALGIPSQELELKLDRMGSRPEFEPMLLKEDVGLEELARVESRREWFPSVQVEQTAKRTYPEGPVIAHVLGHLGEVSEDELGARGAAARELHVGDIIGKSGVERIYDATLRGHRGWKLVEVNSLGRRLGVSRTGLEPQDGEPLRLTLDLRLQRALVEALGDESGAGVFMDPRNGEVLALVSAPAYDPNVFAGGVSPETWKKIVEDPRRPLHDRALNSSYAPGSTFKVVMAIMALEAGVITPSTVMNCSGSLKLYDRRFLCWKRGGHGPVNVHEALVHSCNVFFYQVGKMAGIETIHRYGDLFNLGRPTGIDLPGEAHAVLPSPEWKRETRDEPWYAGETISVSIGQGLVNVTPIQMATMISSVANGGWLLRPHLREDSVERVKLPVSEETLRAIRSALEEVVSTGTGRQAGLESVRVAGKTGTAQVYKHSAGIDSDKLPKGERDHAWFVGYAPVERPEIAFAVVVEHGGHGGTSAAPVVRRVLETYFSDRPPLGKASPELQAGLERTTGSTGASTAGSR